MPANRIPQFEHICGIHFVTEYLAGHAHRIMVDIPTGKPASALDTNALQMRCVEALASLMHCYRGEVKSDDTEALLSNAISGLVWHRENVRRTEMPELSLEDAS